MFLLEPWDLPWEPAMDNSKDSEDVSQKQQRLFNKAMRSRKSKDWNAYNAVEMTPTKPLGVPIGNMSKTHLIGGTSV